MRVQLFLVVVLCAAASAEKKWWNGLMNLGSQSQYRPNAEPKCPEIPEPDVAIEMQGDGKCRLLKDNVGGFDLFVIYQIKCKDDGGVNQSFFSVR